MSLVTTRNIADQDACYAALIAAHKGLSAEESAALNARLILILANHIGETAVLEDALKLAQESGRRRKA